VSAVFKSPKVIILRALPEGADSRVLRWGDIFRDFKKLYLSWGGGSNNILNFRPASGSVLMAVWYVIFAFMCFLN